MSRFSDIDWCRFWIHFFFGVVIGAAIGFGIFSQTPYASSTSESNTPVVVIMSASALVIGIFGGIFGDDLWTRIHKFFW